MNAPLTTRALVESDLDDAIALWRETEGVELAEGDDRKELARYLARNPGLSRVAFAEGQLAGAMLCGHDGRRGLIYHLAVAPAWRGCGIGRRLLAEGVDGLRAAGLKRAIILVEKGNTAAREFWLARGFEDIAAANPMGLDL